MTKIQSLESGKYPHDVSEEELTDYAWCWKNSEKETHAVGTTAKSFVVNGIIFHDLIGNVWKWTNDWPSDPLEGGVDPQGPQGRRTDALRQNRLFRGGGWGSEPRGLRAAHHYGYSPGAGAYDLGFRSVRTLR